MNENLLEILTRKIIASLSLERRQLYEFIVEAEDELAQQAKTSEDFLALLAENCPYMQAAKHFNRPYVETINLMNDIEKEIDEKLQQKAKKVKWIDCTDLLSKKREETSRKSLLYLFVI